MAIYITAMVVLSVLFRSHIMLWWGWISGLLAVCAFFYYSNRFTQVWQQYSSKYFAKKLFRTAITIRLCYVIVSYFFYMWQTGKPFEWSSADAWIYHLTASGMATQYWNGNFNIVEVMNRAYGSELGISDSGFPIYLSFVYFLTGKSIFISRCLNAAMSAYVCISTYKLARRNFGEYTARMAAIFCMLMPNLIYYCGISLKETAMVFIIMLFLERSDALMRDRTFRFWETTWVVLLAFSLFTFRTVLGVVAILALGFALVMSSSRVVGWGRRVVIILLCLIMAGAVFNERIQTEIDELRNTDVVNAQKSAMDWRNSTLTGSSLAKYAGAAVFAPLIFTIPFPTMVNVPDQQNQMFLNGGNFVKNITSFFTIIAILIFVFSGKWRQHILPLSFLLGYLLVLVFSNFAHSERFHMPILPLSMMLAAYGIENFNPRYKNLYLIWIALMFVAAITWNWSKLSGRGMA